MPHLNNKQSKNTNPNSSRQDYHLTQPWPTEEKQKTNKQTKKTVVCGGKNVIDNDGESNLVKSASGEMKQVDKKERQQKYTYL